MVTRGSGSLVLHGKACDDVQVLGEDLTTDGILTAAEMAAEAWRQRDSSPEAALATAGRVLAEMSDPTARRIAMSTRAVAWLALDELKAARKAVDAVLAELTAPGAPASLPEMTDGQQIRRLGDRVFNVNMVDPGRLSPGLAEVLSEACLAGLRAAHLGNDPEAALPFGMVALKLAKHHNLIKLAARAHNDIAAVYGGRSLFEHAMHHLRSGIELLEGAGEKVGPSLLNNLGNIYMSSERVDEALACFQRGREEFGASGDQHWEAIARTNEGRALVRIGRREEGVAALEEALASFRNLNKPTYVATTLGKLGSAWASAGDNIAAERCFKEALKVYEVDPNTTFRGEVHDAYGEFLLQVGDPEGALRELTVGEEVCLTAGAESPANDMVRQQARALRLLGRHEEAFGKLNSYLEKREKLDHDRGQAVISILLVEMETRLQGSQELAVFSSQALSDANRALREQAERLERLSSTDELTELYNRRFLDRRIKEEIVRADQQNRDIGLVLLDIDAFKAINDKYSHVIGDEVLRRIALILRNSFRRTDVVARWGGEEFAILLPNTRKESASLVADKARTAIAEHDWFSVAPGLNVTVSAGVAAVSEARGGDKAIELLKLADRRLYVAKDQGRDRVVADW